MKFMFYFVGVVTFFVLPKVNCRPPWGKWTPVISAVLTLIKFYFESTASS